MRNTAITELEDELWMLAEQGLFSAGACDLLIEGKQVMVDLHGVSLLLGVEWPRFANGVPVLVLDRRYPEDGILLPEEGTASVEVRIAYHAPVAYELLTVTMRQELPGHETRRIPLRACGDGRHDVWMTSLADALAAGTQIAKQLTGGLVVDALARCNPPTVLAEPEEYFTGKDEVCP